MPSMVSCYKRYAWSILLCLILHALVGNGHGRQSRNRLAEALDTVLGHLRTPPRSNSVRNLTAYPSLLGRRCTEHAACEYPVPPVDAENVAFFNGEIHVNMPESMLQEIIQQLSTFYGARSPHLPSSLVQLGTSTDWIAGPKIVNSPEQVSACQWDNPNSEANRNNTHAFFLFPWETNNAFHTLNDNVLSVLSNVIQHYLATPVTTVPPQDTPVYTLHVFRVLARNKQLNSTVLYDLLPVIFGEGNVISARRVLKGGPHCFKHLAWSTANKPIYKDTLVDLRRASFDVLQHILHSYHADNKAALSTALPVATTLAQSLPQQQSAIVRNTGANSTATELVRRPRVIIITRKGTTDPSRKLNIKSEEELAVHFQRAGFATEICCDFQTVNTVALLVDKFQDVDICVGIHGAGLSNCIFGRRGVVIVEFQTHHNFGSLLFQKLAHMASGHHVFYDARFAGKMQGKLKGGIILTKTAMQEVVVLSKKIYAHSERTRLVERLNRSNKRSALTCEQLRQAGALTGNSLSATIEAWLGTGDGNAVIQCDLRAYTSAPPASEVVIVEPATSTLYLKSPQPSNDHALTSSVYVKAVLGLDQYHVNSVNDWLQRVVYVKTKDPKLQSTYLSDIVTRNQQTYWLQLNPSTQPYTKESILGPRIPEISAQCSQLLYQQFRHMVFLPEDSVLKECDKHVILRKRSGEIDGLLLTAFI